MQIKCIDQRVGRKTWGLKSTSKKYYILQKAIVKKTHAHKNTWTLAWIQFCTDKLDFKLQYKKKKIDDKVSAWNLHNWTDRSGVFLNAMTAF